MFVKKHFLLLLMTLTVSTVMAQTEGAEGGFQFEEEKPLGAEGASGTEGALSNEALNGSEGIIRASGVNNGSEGSGTYDGGSVGSGEIIRSEGTTLGNDDQIFVRPNPPAIGSGGGSNPVGEGGIGSIDPGSGTPSTESGGGGAGAIPVDGGLAFLLLAGAGYGSKKAYELRKKNKLKV